MLKSQLVKNPHLTSDRRGRTPIREPVQGNSWAYPVTENVLVRRLTPVYAFLRIGEQAAHTCAIAWLQPSHDQEGLAENQESLDGKNRDPDDDLQRRGDGDPP